MARNTQNQSPESNWNFHVWRGAQRSAPMQELQAASNAMDIDRVARRLEGQNNTVVGAQQYDGDRIAWQAFLMDYGRKTGGHTTYSGGPLQERQMQNAARIDKVRRDRYMKYIAAGGTMNRSDFLRESGLSTVYGGY